MTEALALSHDRFSTLSRLAGTAMSDPERSDLL